MLADFRGRGVGHALMSRAEEWARDHGAHVLMLDTHAENADAIRFYTELLSYRHVGVVLTKEVGRGRESSDPSLTTDRPGR